LFPLRAVHGTNGHAGPNDAVTNGSTGAAQVLSRKMMARILGPSNSWLNLERIDRSALSLGSARGLGLYGSWARGTNHQESDLDVWIRADSLPPESVLARLQRDLSLQADSEVNLLVLTPEKLERLKIDDAPFYNSLVMSSVTLIGEPLEEDWPMLFDRIRSVRHADQYSFMALPTEEEVQASIDLAERFMERMERLLKETRGKAG